MGLKKWIACKAYAWYWRLRYWWMDTANGLRTRIVLSVLAGIVGIVNLVGMFYVVHQASDATHPQQSVVAAVVILIIALVAAIVAIAMMPKPKDQAPQQADSPTVQDGQSVKVILGTRWVPDGVILAWKIMGRDPIKADGGK